MPTVQDLYAAAVLADPNLYAYYKLDEASGLPQDLGPFNRHMTSASPTVTYGHPGPFQGSKACRFTAVAGNMGFIRNQPAENSGNTCYTHEAWIMVESIGGANGACWMRAHNLKSVLRSNRKLEGWADFLGGYGQHSLALAIGEWYYWRWDRHVGGLSTYNVAHVDDVDDTPEAAPGGPWSVAIPYDGPFIGLTSPPTFGAGATGTIRVSNAAFYIGCPHPDHFPPPEPLFTLVSMNWRSADRQSSGERVLSG